MPKRHTYSDTDVNAQFHSYADREPDAKSDSSCTAASDPRASPDTLTSGAASRMGISVPSAGAQPRSDGSIESLSFPLAPR